MARSDSVSLSLCILQDCVPAPHVTGGHGLWRVLRGSQSTRTPMTHSVTCRGWHRSPLRPPPACWPHPVAVRDFSASPDLGVAGTELGILTREVQGPIGPGRSHGHPLAGLGLRGGCPRDLEWGAAALSPGSWQLNAAKEVRAD